jgi:SAM-dependent methyltransferase
MVAEAGVAPDGSPVELYLRLPGDREAGLIDAAVPAGSRVLDLGCGVGRVAAELIATGHRVTGVDDSAEMLAHAAARGVDTVQADLVGLALGRRFDVVLLLSHLVNDADPRRRAAFWAAAADHVQPDGQVVVERHHPDWIRGAVESTAEHHGVEIELHDLDHRGDVLGAQVTYRIDGRSFTQSFDAVALDDDALAAEAAAHGLVLAGWLDDGQELARFTVGPALVPTVARPG